MICSWSVTRALMSVILLWSILVCHSPMIHSRSVTKTCVPLSYDLLLIDDHSMSVTLLWSTLDYSDQDPSCVYHSPMIHSWSAARFLMAVPLLWSILDQWPLWCVTLLWSTLDQWPEFWCLSFSCDTLLVSDHSWSISYNPLCPLPLIHTWSVTTTLASFTLLSSAI